MLPMTYFFRSLPVLLVVSFLSVNSFAQQSSPNLEIVKRWLSTNSGISSIRIDFTQTRKMRSLKVPIRQDGSLWLDYSGSRNFRWQTGNPPQTIVVGNGKQIVILRTPMKKYEVRASGADAAPGMSALAKGFPRTLEDFNAKYRVLEIVPHENTFRIVARPLGPAGRGVDTFTFVVERDRYRLLGIELDLQDGSSIDTVFNQVNPNVALPADLFRPDLTGYKETKF